VLRPLAANVSGLPAGFTFPLMSMRVPAGAPYGRYTIKIGFFDPSRTITGEDDAFLLVVAPFDME
jgi:hypothetical protein